MKDQSQAAIQFSGYPLRIAEPEKKAEEDPGLIVRLQPQLQTTFIQKSLISNDPAYWDPTWFNCYE